MIGLRSDGYGGVFCHSSLPSQEITINTTCEVMACEIKLCHSISTIACSIYRPPNSSAEYFQCLCSILEEITLSHPNSAIWITGDFNLPDINWTNLTIDQYNYPIRLNQELLDFLNNHGYSQHVTFPTRLSNTLDIFIRWCSSPKIKWLSTL